MLRDARNLWYLKVPIKDNIKSFSNLMYSIKNDLNIQVSYSEADDANIQQTIQQTIEYSKVNITIPVIHSSWINTILKQPTKQRIHVLNSQWTKQSMAIQGRVLMLLWLTPFFEVLVIIIVSVI